MYHLRFDTYLTRDESLALIVQLWLAGHFTDNEVLRKLAQAEGR